VTLDLTKLKTIVAQQPYPLAFATVSGAHLYGFPSPDSDYDLRGVHVLPPQEMLGLYPKRETLETHGKVDDIELDLVTHDVQKFMNMMLRPNGYVLEQLTSPLVVHTSQAHDALKALAPACVTSGHVNHYMGFARNQWELLNKGSVWRAKPLLYVYRVLLTGIHLMKTGKIQANLVQLNETFKLSYIPDLIARKAGTHEQTTLDDADRKFHQREYERLLAQLEREGEKTKLPDGPNCAAEMNTLLLRLRGLKV
jgi:uncharacterized protein